MPAIRDLFKILDEASKEHNIGFILKYDEAKGTYDFDVYSSGEGPSEHLDTAATVVINSATGQIDQSDSLATLKRDLEAAARAKGFDAILDAANAARNNDATKAEEIAEFKKAQKETYEMAQLEYSRVKRALEEADVDADVIEERLKLLKILATPPETETAETPPAPTGGSVAESRLGDSDDEADEDEDKVVLEEKDDKPGPKKRRDSTTSKFRQLRQFGQLGLAKKKEEEEKKPVSGQLGLLPKKPGTSGELSLPKSKDKPFPASPSNSGAHRIRMITWTRAYYGLSESNVLYPITFAKARTAQTDSNEFMKFFGQFLSEINIPRDSAQGRIPVPSKKDLEAALYDLQHTEINYPYNSLKEVLLRSSDPDINQRRDPALYEYIHWIRLNQYARNSFPFGFETEDSEYITERMNKFGWGSRPRAEMEASLQNAIDFYGVGMKDEGKGNYTITQNDKPIIKVHVGENGGKVTFNLQPGIADEDIETAIKHMLTMHASHIQQNCSNSFEAKLGGKIYHNIRMLQLAIYDHNFHVTFKGGADEALQKMLRQIDALDESDAKKDELREEVNWLVFHAQTFDPTVPQSGSKVIAARCYADIDTNRILNPDEIQAAVNAGTARSLSLAETQQLFIERSQQQVGKIFPPKPGPTPPTSKPLDPAQNLGEVGSKRLRGALGG